MQLLNAMLPDAADYRRYEGRIVQQMIVNDGGTGDYTEVTPPMLGIWDTVLGVGSTSFLTTPQPATHCCCT